MVDCSNKTDEELVQLILQDQEFFSCVVSRYEGKMLRYIKRIAGVSDEDAQDLLQEIFIKVYKNLNDFDTNLKFSSWLYRIAHNLVISEYRKKQARPQLIGGEAIDEFLHNVDSGINIEKEINHGDMAKDIEKVLEKMDLKYREILILKFLEEKDYREISDILQKPMGTIGTLINRAKRIFIKTAEKMNVNFS
ncbi:MAG: RNA polymerase sigma factor [bacterium]|nr:RNA polymerase sigma factor [bacterium]